MYWIGLALSLGKRIRRRMFWVGLFMGSSGVYPFLYNLAVALGLIWDFMLL